MCLTLIYKVKSNRRINSRLLFNGFNFLASGLGYKELGSRHSRVLTTRKLICKSTVFLRSIRKLRSPGKSLPQKLERQTGRYQGSQLTGAETTMGTRTGEGKLLFVNCWRLSVDKPEKNSKATCSSLTSHFCEFHPQESSQVLTVKTGKSPLLLLAGRGERSHFERHSKHSAILNKASSLRKLFHQSLTLLEFFQGPNDLREVFQVWEGKYPTTSSSSNPASPKKETERHLRMSQPRGTGKLLLPSHLSTISLNAYLTTVLFTMSYFQQLLHRY